MIENTSTTTSSAEDEDLKAPSQPWGLYIGIGLAGLAVFGLITWLLGLGPFAYRQIFYGTSEIYILNLSDEEVEVTLDLGSPIKIQPEGYHRTPILGGTTTLTTKNLSGEELESLEVFVDGKPLVYNVKGARCLVLADVSSFYIPTKDNTIDVLETFTLGSRVVHLPNDRVIWPRETLRDEVRSAEKGVSWVEIVACPLLEPEEKPLLSSHLNVLLTERKKRQRELEIRKRMMQKNGSEAVEAFVTPKTTIATTDAGTDATVESADTQGETQHDGAPTP